MTDKTPPQSVAPTLDEFIDALRHSGWQSRLDAQWIGAETLWKRWWGQEEQSRPCERCRGSGELIKNDTANRDPADDYAVPCPECALPRDCEGCWNRLSECDCPSPILAIRAPDTQVAPSPLPHKYTCECDECRPMLLTKLVLALVEEHPAASGSWSQLDQATDLAKAVMEMVLAHVMGDASAHRPGREYGRWIKGLATDTGAYRNTPNPSPPPRYPKCEPNLESSHIYPSTPTLRPDARPHCHDQQAQGNHVEPDMALPCASSADRISRPDHGRGEQTGTNREPQAEADRSASGHPSPQVAPDSLVARLQSEVAGLIFDNTRIYQRETALLNENAALRRRLERVTQAADAMRHAVMAAYNTTGNEAIRPADWQLGKLLERYDAIRSETPASQAGQPADESR